MDLRRGSPSLFLSSKPYYVVDFVTSGLVKVSVGARAFCPVPGLARAYYPDGATQRHGHRVWAYLASSLS